MSIADQINQIKVMRDKAIAAYERAAMLAEKHRKEAEDFKTALDVLSKLVPPDVREVTGPSHTGFVRAPSGPIYQRILELLRSSDQLWWTANQIKDGLEAQGDLVKMTSISPNLSRLKDAGDIVRDDLKIALADRAEKKTEASDGLFDKNQPSKASNDHDLTNRGTPPSSLVKPWAGGGT